MDRSHNPEFTMMELYVPFKDYNWMMEYVEKMFEHICNSVFGTLDFIVDGKQINFKAPWKRLSMIEAIEAKTGLNVLSCSIDDLKTASENFGIDAGSINSRAKFIDELFSASVEPELIQPTFIIDYPLELSPLAKKHRTKAGVVERFEGYIFGREICNAFSELNDPIDQRNRFEDQVKLREEGDEEAHQIDEDFIRALEFGMPPTAGLGVGIDRIVMLLTNQPSIRDVIFFPQMKPEVKS
jgi:lysyl-tRNA synthetase class 2